MTTYTGGDTVKAGFYWNRAQFGAEIVPAAGAALAGAPDVVYYRLPWPVLLVAAPVMGGTPRQTPSGPVVAGGAA